MLEVKFYDTVDDSLLKFAKVRVYACLSRLSCGEMSKGDTQQVPPFELSPLRVDMARAQ